MPHTTSHWRIAAMPYLTEDELASAQVIINKTASGIYELREIYGHEWEEIESPTSFGARFKKSVCNGNLQRIKLSSLKTNNHYTYEIA
jgi:hypothetical protein